MEQKESGIGFAQGVLCMGMLLACPFFAAPDQLVSAFRAQEAQHLPSDLCLDINSDPTGQVFDVGH